MSILGVSPLRANLTADDVRNRTYSLRKVITQAPQRNTRTAKRGGSSMLPCSDRPTDACLAFSAHFCVLTAGSEREGIHVGPAHGRRGPVARGRRSLDCLLLRQRCPMLFQRGGRGGGRGGCRYRQTSPCSCRAYFPALLHRLAHGWRPVGPWRKARAGTVAWPGRAGAGSGGVVLRGAAPPNVCGPQEFRGPIPPRRAGAGDRPGV